MSLSERWDLQWPKLTGGKGEGGMVKKNFDFTVHATDGRLETPVICLNSVSLPT